MSEFRPKLVPLHEAMRDAKTGDVLLFRGRGFRHWVMARLMGGPWTHAAIIDEPPFATLEQKVMASLFSAAASPWLLRDTLQFRGNRYAWLQDIVRDEPEQWDIFRVKCASYRRTDALQPARQRTGSGDYGWCSLLLAALRYLPVTRWLVPQRTDDVANGSLPHCSQLVSRCLRAGGVDPICWTPDRLTTPTMLARSPALKYRCTLIP